jgi:uncharacterized membrane protein YkvA (DUF1232 family)
MSKRDDLSKYGRHYSETGLARKVARMPSRTSRLIVEQAITLYVILTDRETPMWARALIIAALGYFICPIDVIPDTVPLLGYADDAIVLATVVSRLGHMVTSAMHERVQRLMPNGLKRARN